MKRPYRPYWRDHRALWFWLLCALLIVWRVKTASNVPVGTERIDEGNYEVRRVVDGDTLLLVSGDRVRLQGVDVPETVQEDQPVEPWGPEASRFAKDFVAGANGRVRLTFGLERKDQYDRFLAFVWNGDRLLNEELVRAGLARAKLGYRYSGTMKRRLADAQDEARRAGREIWSNEKGTGPIVGSRL